MTWWKRAKILPFSLHSGIWRKHKERLEENLISFAKKEEKVNVSTRQEPQMKSKTNQDKKDVLKVLSWPQQSPIEM